MKIIVVDDEPEIRDMLRHMLNLDGHEVIDAADGKQALELIRQEQPDLIVSDISMPEMSGNELFQQVRASSGTMGMLPFIFLSANMDSADTIDHLNSGANACFKKPVELKLLRAHVNSLLLNSSRHSNFLNENLSKIANTIPQTMQHTLRNLEFSATDPEVFAATISSTIQSLVELASDSDTHETRPSNKAGTLDALDFVQICLLQINKMQSLIDTQKFDSLAWWLILTVTESQLSDHAIFVSDLYNSAPSAKSTTHSKLDQLVSQRVFIKSSHQSDGRRQEIRLSTQFEHKLQAHIDYSIGRVAKLVS